MFSSWRRLSLPIVLLIGTFLASFLCILPSLHARIYLSPDETANAVLMGTVLKNGSMKLAEPLLKQFPWVHPRSFVTQGEALVPVGFVGLPLILSLFELIFGGLLVGFVIPLLVLSVVFPLWRLLRSWGKATQLVAAFTWLSFPTVILYSNRSFFPNLPLVALMVWVVYLVQSAKTSRRLLVAGLLFALAVIIRPIELFWMLPWLWLAWRVREERNLSWKSCLRALLLGSLIPLLGYLLVVWRTYGSPFAVGYFLRDTVVSEQCAVSSAQCISAGGAVLPTAHRALLTVLWPFGFHPRDIWFNVVSYLFGIWLPWTVVSLFTALCLWAKKAARPVILVSLWTLVGGLLVYGETIYQDHVGVNVVSTGNSFLRYLLPLAPILVAGFAIGVTTLARQLPARLRSLVIFMCLLAIVSLGLSISWNGDEGIQASVQDVQSYVAIRSAASRTLSPSAIVLSERSDKIFFPMFRTASPVPSMTEAARLAQTTTDEVAYFSTTMSDSEQQSWLQAGVEAQPLFTIGNQTMYDLVVPTTCLQP